MPGECKELNALPQPGVPAATDIFLKLVQVLEERSVPYCILAGYDDYPASMASDVDFMVPNACLRNMAELLARVAACCDAHLIQHIPHETTAAWTVIARLDGARLHCLQPDASSDYRRNGRFWLSAEDLLSRRRRHRMGFYVPAAADAFTYYLIKKIDKGGLDDVQAAQLSARYGEDPSGCARALRKLLSEADACALEWAACSGDWSGIRPDLTRLQRCLGANAIQEIWFERVRQRCADLHRQLLRLVRPAGMSIVFLGPDGSGKSSVIDGLQGCLRPAFRGVIVQHLRCGVLPIAPLARRKAEHAASESAAPDVVTAPHRQASRGVAASIAKLGYFWLDYLLGNVLAVWPRKVRSMLLLFDRHYYDILADPKRYRYAGPGGLARMLGRAMPRPDLVFVLDAPVAVVRARKQEVSPDESARQRLAYLELAREFRAVHVIDASQPLERVIASVLQHVVAALEARTAQHLGLPLPHPAVAPAQPRISTEPVIAEPRTQGQDG